MKTRLTLLFTAIAGFTFAQQPQQTPYQGQLNQTYPTNQNQQSFNATTLPANNQQISPTGAYVGSVPAGQHVCKTYELNQQYWQSQGMLQQFNQETMQAAMNVSPVGIDKTPGVNTISVIFHVVHNTNNPAENVSNALIMQVFNDISEDYQLLNADAANARTGLGFIPADPNINFCLATQDPLGNPLTEIGVERTSTSEDWYDSNNGEENKMKSVSTGGADPWDRNKYLNVWICDISNGATSGTAGYAYRPTPTTLPSSAIDGIVLDYNLGMNNANVLTHEIGHYLGLDHTWGGSGGCGNDDGFGDTPITDGPSFNYPGSCSGSQQTCAGTETQYENYMDYANCTVMFTQNQADYMLTILQGIRNSLLISPGCDPTNTPPNSAFTSIPAGPAPVIIPVNGSVSFFDESTNAPTGWAWTISGTQGTDWNYINGTTGASQDPQVEFYNVGLYDVTLTASNAFGTDATPASEVGYVQVVAPASGTACDTLRNYDPNESYYTLTSTNGYVPGNNNISTENILEWAEPYTAAATTQVRRLEFAPTRVEDAGGNVIFKVYADNAGVPGTVMASETVPLADLTELQWNSIDFTTPATVTGNFWVGYELSYAATDTFAMLTTYQAPIPPVNYLWGNFASSGWTDIGPVFGTTFAQVMDVLTSNGPAPTANFTATDAEVCEGGSIDVNGSNSTNVTDYFWYLTDDPFTTVISSSSTASNTYNFPTAGNYAIYLFGDGSCMTDAVYLPVIVDLPVSATVSSTNTTCGDNNGTITISSPSGGDGTYYYSLDGSNYYTSSTFNNLPAGTYDVYVATAGSNCETVYSTTINPSTPFQATVSANASVCPGGSTTITASGGVNYQWFDGTTLISSSPSVLVTPATQTQYSCIVTDGSGCTSTVFTTVSIFATPAAPTITASGNTTICAGSSVDLTSSYPTGNVWSTAETGSTITVSTGGSYSVTYTDGNGCTSTSSPTVVTINPAPSISAGTVTDPTSCATATGSIQVSGSGSGDLSWSGTATGSATGVTLPYTIPNLAAGSYNITFTDAIGCVSNLLSQALTDPTPPTAPTITPSGATTFCDGGSVTLASSYGSGNTWSTTETTASIVVTTSGSYSVTYTDGSGCSSSSTPIVITVNNNPNPPSITPSGATTFCDGGSVILTSSQGTGNTWSTTETTQAISVTTTGTYTVTYTNTNGCTATSTPVNVTVNPNPSAPTITTSGATTFCDGGSVTLTSSQGSGNTWSTTETTASISVTTSGSYTVTYTDGNGCTATSTPESVTVNPLPTVSAGSDQSVCEGTSVTLAGTGASTYSWDNGVTDNTPFTPATGTVTYTVTGTDANGCTNTDMVDVTVNALPTVTLSALGMACEYNSPFSLTGGSPTGGTYSGTGVTGGQFDPGSTGVGTFTITYDFTDINGCSNSATQDITVDSCLAVIENDIAPISIYPNPVDDKLTVELEGSFEVKVFDARGRLVATFEATDELNINTRDFEAGVYTLHIENANNVPYIERVIKQ